MNKHMDINSTLKIRYCDPFCNNKSKLTDSHWAFFFFKGETIPKTLEMIGILVPVPRNL